MEPPLMASPTPRTAFHGTSHTMENAAKLPGDRVLWCSTIPWCAFRGVPRDTTSHGKLHVFRQFLKNWLVQRQASSSRSSSNSVRLSRSRVRLSVIICALRGGASLDDGPKKGRVCIKLGRKAHAVRSLKLGDEVLVSGPRAPRPTPLSPMAIRSSYKHSLSLWCVTLE